MLPGRQKHAVGAPMLTDVKIKAAKPTERAYKLADSGQLYLLVSAAGGRHWRMNYAFGKNAQGKPKQLTLSLVSYPVMQRARGCRRSCRPIADAIPRR